MSYPIKIRLIPRSLGRLPQILNAGFCGISAAANPAVQQHTASSPPPLLYDGDDFFEPPRPPPQRHRLMDPADQLREVRAKLQTLLHNEYVETKDLAKVLSWADELRQKGISSVPLIDLIGRILSSNSADKQSLIQPLYSAMLKSPESEAFMARAELYRPAVAQMFGSNSDDILPIAQSFWSQFNCTSAEICRTLPPAQLVDLRVYFCAKFRLFLRQLPPAEFVRILSQLCAAIHENDLLLSAPLAHAVDAVKRWRGDARWRNAYNAFMGTAAERQQFIERPHIYYPWMVQQLRDNSQWFPGQHASSDNTKLGIVLSLIRCCVGNNSKNTKKLTTTTAAVPSPAPPPFLVELLHQSVSKAFSCACVKGDFIAADQIWQFMLSANISDQKQPPYQIASSLPIDVPVRDVLLFAIHLWTIGGNSKKRAREIMHFYVGKTLARETQRTKNGHVTMMLRKLNGLNINYRQQLLKTTNNGRREQCHRTFVNAVHDALLQQRPSLSVTMQQQQKKKHNRNN